MGLKVREQPQPWFYLGDGIELRPLRRGDSPELFSLVEANRERLRRWMPWVDGARTLDSMIGFVNDTQRQHRLGRALRFGVVVGGELAGVISIEGIEHDHHRAFVGYWIDGACEGHGIMTRAVIALCDHAFGVLGLNRIEVHCGTDNWRSRRIPERLGFAQEGILRQREWLNDRFVDHALYAMLADDWRQV